LILTVTAFYSLYSFSNGCYASFALIGIFPLYSLKPSPIIGSSRCRYQWIKNSLTLPCRNSSQIFIDMLVIPFGRKFCNKVFFVNSALSEIKVFSCMPVLSSSAGVYGILFNPIVLTRFFALAFSLSSSVTSIRPFSLARTM